jgi:hypothetical protein
MDYKKLLQSNYIFVNKIPYAVNIIKEPSRSLFISRCNGMGKT